MALMLADNPVPLHLDEGGTYRVGNTRVRLESVLYLHKQGATPEQIVSELPALKLRDVYAVISFYLHNQAEVDLYIAQREREADELRAMVEAESPHKELRAKLKERWAARTAEKP